MLFPVIFYRQLGGGTGPLLGSDTAPTPSANGADAIAQPTPQPPTGLANGDCVLSCQATSADGLPVQRIGVLYGYNGSGTAPALTGTLYFLERATGLWFLASAKSVALTIGGLTFFDAHPMSNQVPFSNGPAGTPPGQSYVPAKNSLQYVLIVDKVGSVDGQYYFGMAPLLTASP